MNINELPLPDHDFNTKGYCITCGCQKQSTGFNERHCLHPQSKCPGLSYNDVSNMIRQHEITPVEDSETMAKEIKAIVLFQLLSKLEKKINEANQQNFQLDGELRKKERQIEILSNELAIYKSDPKNQGRMIATILKERAQALHQMEETLVRIRQITQEHEFVNENLDVE